MYPANRPLAIMLHARMYVANVQQDMMFLLRISIEGPLHWLATLVKVSPLHISSASSACNYVAFISFRNRLAGTRFQKNRGLFSCFTARDACHGEESFATGEFVVHLGTRTDIMIRNPRYTSCLYSRIYDLPVFVYSAITRNSLARAFLSSKTCA